MAAPGRVNLIGEHTDYNGGFVLPMAIDRHLVAAAAPAAGPPLAGGQRPAAGAGGDRARCPACPAAIPPGPTTCGGCWPVSSAAVALPALDVVLESNLPLGGGLSSSAALEVATATLIEAAAGQTLDALDKARLCQRAEQWAGVPCGIMDQLVAVAGQPAGALLIDCESERFQVVPLAEDEVGVLVTDSGVRHALGDGEYARRRQECTEAARAAGRAQPAGGHRPAAGGARPCRRRWTAGPATWSRRTPGCWRSSHAFQRRDFAAAGRAAVRQPPLAARRLPGQLPRAGRAGGRSPGRWVRSAGVLGARLTGGGFGGCTVTLVERPRLPELAAAIAAEYQRRTGRRTAPFAVRAAAGARKLALDPVLF